MARPNQIGPRSLVICLIFDHQAPKREQRYRPSPNSSVFASARLRPSNESWLRGGTLIRLLRLLPYFFTRNAFILLGRYQMTISSVFLAFIIELACRQTNSGQKSLLNALVKVELKNNTVSPLIVAVPVDVKERCAEHAMLYTQPLCIRTRTFNTCISVYYNMHK